jgi:anthranilate phosphoribosyltransferase
MAPVMAQVFADRGVAALVFRGDDGLDELTVSTTSSVWRVVGGQVQVASFDPESVGIGRAPLEALRGGDRAHNAEVVRQVLAGQEQGPIRDAVLLNAAAALVSLDDSAGVGVDDLDAAMQAGLVRAASAVDDGAASAALERWVEATRSLA